jgi:GLPGLI family protein
MRPLLNIFICTLAICAQIPADAQGIRVHYGFERKQSLEDTKYSAYMDMRTDYDGSTAAFYSEKAFVKDSLKQYAFDKNGNALDNEAYSKLVRLPGGMKEVSLIDFKNNAIVLGYKPGFILIRGEGNLDLPKWSLTDETGELNGYKTKKAVGEYYGRKWTIWYTEEIPYNVGPWLLWGAPGLIVKAEDEDKIFSFYMMYVEELSTKSRYDFINYSYDPSSSYQSEKDRKYTFGLKDAEKMYTRMLNDRKYSEQIQGIISAQAFDRSGREYTEAEMDAFFKYIPLISESYWK